MRRNLFWQRRACETCGKKRYVAVSSSVLGPISTASCRLCSVLYAEPFFLVESAFEVNEGHCADWVYELYTFKDGFYHQVKDLFSNDAYWIERRQNTYRSKS